MAGWPSRHGGSIAIHAGWLAHAVAALAGRRGHGGCGLRSRLGLLHGRAAPKRQGDAPPSQRTPSLGRGGGDRARRSGGGPHLVHDTGHAAGPRLVARCPCVLRLHCPPSRLAPGGWLRTARGLRAAFLRCGLRPGPRGAGRPDRDPAPGGVRARRGRSSGRLRSNARPAVWAVVGGPIRRFAGPATPGVRPATTVPPGSRGRHPPGPASPASLVTRVDLLELRRAAS